MSRCFHAKSEDLIRLSDAQLDLGHCYISLSKAPVLHDRDTLILLFVLLSLQEIGFNAIWELYKSPDQPSVHAIGPKSSVVMGML